MQAQSPCVETGEWRVPYIECVFCEFFAATTMDEPTTTKKKATCARDAWDDDSFDFTSKGTVYGPRCAATLIRLQR